jgi:hypothetical protein
MNYAIGIFIVYFFAVSPTSAEDKMVFAKVTSEDMNSVTVLECYPDIYNKMSKWSPVTGKDYSIKEMINVAKLQLEVPTAYKCEFLSLILNPVVAENGMQLWYYNVAFRFIPDLEKNPGIKDGAIIKVVPMLADSTVLSERVE